METTITAVAVIGAGGYSLYAMPRLNGSLRSLNGGLEVVPNHEIKNPQRNPLFPRLPIRPVSTAP